MSMALRHSRVVRWTLILGISVGVGCLVWIKQFPYDDAVASTGFPAEEHRVFRATTPLGSASAALDRATAARTDAANCVPPVTAPATGDWPALFGPSGNGVAPGEAELVEWPGAGPAERWQRAIGRGYSSPVVRGGKLIMFQRVDDEEVIQSLDAQSGSPLWDFRYPTTYTCHVHFSDGPYSTPAIDDERVYAWGAQGTLRCLTLAEGRLVWQRDTSADFEAVANQFPVASSPLVEDGKLILNVGGKSKQAGIVALDAKTGQTLWTATDHLASYATPTAATFHGHRYVLVFTQTGLVALDPDDGRIVWSVNYRSMNDEFVNSTSPLVVGNCIVLSGWSLGCLCIEVLPDGTYKERWRDRRGIDSQYVNLVSDGEYLYGCSARDTTYRCVDLKTGKVRWAWRGDIIGRGAYSILVGRRAILFGEPGILTALELGGDEPVQRAMTAEPMLASPCYTMPALAGGLLYLRNESTLRCFDLTARQ